MKTKQNKILLISVAVAIVIILGALWHFSAPKTAPVAAAPLDAFAQCLAQKGLTMYGLYSCPHCQAEKTLFGPSFQYVNYVECSENPQKCTADNVDAVPTWIEKDGTRLVGTQSLAQLAQASGCQLPIEH
ncbi:MAG: hypothetical protein M1335_02340 [Chloroflexi bacterium]|nr:hypothetical protein [Chloroflexota bacterium]